MRWNSCLTNLGFRSLASPGITRGPLNERSGSPWDLGLLCMSVRVAYKLTDNFSYNDLIMKYLIKNITLKYKYK